MLKLGILGVCGKMGRRIADLADKDTDVAITGALEIPESPEMGIDVGVITGKEDLGVKVISDPALLDGKVDCVIDFTLPEPALEHLKVCREKGIPMVIGTTGFTEEGEQEIKDASSVIPIVFSPNMSIGMNVLFKIVSEAARVLGKEFSIKVDETHHVHKKDSPSGTAKMIGKVIKAACSKEVPIEAFRKGEVIGNHGIIFDGAFEQLEIRHDAKTRDVFAAGAIEAAKFVYNKSPELYDMADVLGLN